MKCMILLINTGYSYGQLLWYFMTLSKLSNKKMLDSNFSNIVLKCLNLEKYTISVNTTT